MLKIDRTFVAAASAADGQSALLARTIIGLGAAVGLPTVAEGIELPAQVTLVQELGCRYGQGYLFARPADAETTIALLRASAEPPTPPRRARPTPTPLTPEPQWALG